jgi:membrane protein DedA with SNARE-associated domain
MFDWSSLVQHYGYLAVLIGSFFEGETVLMLGAYAVHQHILSFWPLVGIAMFGGFLGDQLYYFIGYRYGYNFIRSRPKLNKKFKRASQMIVRFPTLSILLMRFLWGLRTIIPMSFGILRYPAMRYLAVNLLASFIWAFVVISVGMQVSHWLHVFWHMLLPHQKKIIIIAAVISCIIIARIIYGRVVKLQDHSE